MPTDKWQVISCTDLLKPDQNQSSLSQPITVLDLCQVTLSGQIGSLDLVMWPAIAVFQAWTPLEKTIILMPNDKCQVRSWQMTVGSWQLYLWLNRACKGRLKPIQLVLANHRPEFGSGDPVWTNRKLSFGHVTSYCSFPSLKPLRKKIFFKIFFNKF